MKLSFSLCVLLGRAFLLTSTYVVKISGAQESSNETCSFLGLLPFADDKSYSPVLNSSELAFSYLTAMRLATDHLNTRDNSVVPNLSDLLDGCTLKFNVMYSSDTQHDYFHDFKAIMDSRAVADICGVIGPYEYKGQLKSSLLASVLNIPQLLFSGGDTKDLTGNENTATVGNLIGFDDYFEIMADYLEKVFRIKSLAMITAGTQRDQAMVEAFAKAMDKAGIANRVLGFDPNSRENPSLFKQDLQSLKSSGIRNIFFSPNDGGPISMLEVANALYSGDTLNGDYFFILGGESIGLTDLKKRYGNSTRDSPIAKLLHGAASFAEVDPFALDQVDRFLSEWRKVDAAVIALALKQLLLESQVTVEVDYFSENMPYQYSSFVYDSVIALGLGNCQKQKSGGGSSTTGQRMLGNVTRESPGEPLNMDEFTSNSVVRNIINNVSFVGASGTVDFEFTNGEKVRVASGMSLAVGSFSVVVESDGNLSFDSAVISQRRPGAYWQTTSGAQFGFVNSYATENTNYLTGWVRVFGLSLFALGCLLVLICGGAIAYLEGDALMKIAQPFFLKMICVGSIIENCAIFTLSFDEGAGWSDNALDGACIATPWLFFLGHATIYSAIFCKVRYILCRKYRSNNHNNKFAHTHSFFRLFVSFGALTA